jgi:hypothetical protein
VLILGGADRGEDFGELFRMLPKTVKGIVVTGENADKVLPAFRNMDPDNQYHATSGAIIVIAYRTDKIAAADAPKEVAGVRLMARVVEGVEMKYMFFRSVLRNIWMYSMVINMKDGVLMLILVGFR